MFHCLCYALKEQVAHDTLKEIHLLRCLGSRGELAHSIHLSIHLSTHLLGASSELQWVCSHFTF